VKCFLNSQAVENPAAELGWLVEELGYPTHVETKPELWCEVFDAETIQNHICNCNKFQEKYTGFLNQ
jgi:hypothetical protein